MESLDNGKSVRETRDCDVPLVARHFYHHAGWAQLADTEMRDWKPVGEKDIILIVTLPDFPHQILWKRELLIQLL